VSAREQLSYEEQVNLSDKSLLQQSVILFWSFFDPIHPQVFNPDFSVCQVFKEEENKQSVFLNNLFFLLSS